MVVGGGGAIHNLFHYNFNIFFDDTKGESIS